MLEEGNKFGFLIREKDIKLHRMWFKQMAKLIGVKVGYRGVLRDKHYTTYAEIVSNYDKIKIVDCIFEEHPQQQTLKKLGWASELQEDSSIIHVPYDLENLEQGAIFLLPSGIDNSRGRVFRVKRLSTIMIYPASIACEIVPEYEDTYSDNLNTFEHSSFNLLVQED